MRLFSSRALDLTASALILLVASPVMLLTALAIKLEDGWRAPVLYRQQRVGLGGRPFDVLKFRSMRTDAERDGRAQWAQTRDPRITRVGNIIRKIRVDELPQILNVLRGHTKPLVTSTDRMSSARIGPSAVRNCTSASAAVAGMSMLSTLRPHRRPLEPAR